MRSLFLREGKLLADGMRRGGGAKIALGILSQLWCRNVVGF